MNLRIRSWWAGFGRWRRWATGRTATRAELAVACRVTRIWFAPTAGAPMKAVPRAWLDRDGLWRAPPGDIDARPANDEARRWTGDRYATDRGHWHRIEACRLTVVEAGVARAGEARGFAPGWHRRNIEIDWPDGTRPTSLDGRQVRALKGRLLTVGEAQVVLDRPRPPCGWLDRVSGQGAARELGWDAGWCVVVLVPGWIEVDASALTARRSTPHQET